MILILSHDHIDEPTNHLIDWLLYYKAKFIRINGIDLSFKNEFTINIIDKKLIINNDINFNPNEINVVFYRRWVAPSYGKSYFTKFINEKFKEKEVLLIENYQGFLLNELNSYMNGFFSMFEKNKWIPHYKIARGGLNKLDTLMLAKKNELIVPNSIITSSKTELLLFFESNKNGIITKPISEVVMLEYEQTKISLYTKEITLSEINDLNEVFFPILVQEKIVKEFEIRSFYIENKFYSMAIFSQNDNQTKIDFRNYNYDKPNRNVPFKLPSEIEKKLSLLFKDLELNTGSVDLIYSNENQFVFLEINPVGQSGMVSIGGNYYLEKIIAENLIKKDNEYKKN